MQRLDERKRQDIIDAAVKLFASRPYHDVRLDDVAAAARVGKGTVYLYFEGKEDLYGSLIHDAMDELIADVRDGAGDGTRPTWDRIEQILAALAKFGARHPHVIQLIRAHGNPTNDRELRRKRAELSKVVVGVLRHGIDRGELHDPRPELTAEYIIGLVRSAVLHGPGGVGEDGLCQHMLGMLRNGLTKREAR
jgi:AcrR family transcriptional regulator